ncbi:hypothetical protein PIB30_001713 [Stylosanthes scabra]|uniref:Uncharacterized protein n=1 Tax=Stylosanthes scabra TaxID=79078 RepID=A0ABU6U1R6_9FABA|nr:hypothetical protein [Stylosanthes scabra]
MRKKLLAKFPSTKSSSESVPPNETLGLGQILLEECSSSPSSISSSEISITLGCCDGGGTRRGSNICDTVKHPLWVLESEEGRELVYEETYPSRGKHRHMQQRKWMKKKWNPKGEEVMADSNQC